MNPEGSIPSAQQNHGKQNQAEDPSTISMEKSTPRGRVGIKTQRVLFVQLVECFTGVPQHPPHLPSGQVEQADLTDQRNLLLLHCRW